MKNYIIPAASGPDAQAARNNSVHDLLFGLQQLPPPYLPTYVNQPKPESITVQREGISADLATTRTTVGAALASNGMYVSKYDLVVPGRNEELEPGMTVYVYPAKQVALSDNGLSGYIHTHASTVEGLLANANAVLGEKDRVEPDLSTQVTNNMFVTVTRVREETVIVDEEYPYQTEYRNDPTMDAGTTAVIQDGWPGTHKLETHVVYENEEEKSREIVNSWFDPAPVPQIIARGTRSRAARPSYSVSSTSAASSGSTEGGYSLVVWATWYNASHGGRLPGDPNYGRTATGVYATYGVVAVDPSVIPLGTRMYVPGYGYAVAADTGGGVRGYHIDLAFPEGLSNPWATGYVTIQILP